VSVPPDLALLQHALGLDEYGKSPNGRSYRNRFVANEGSDDFAICMRHAAAGRMTRYEPSALSGGADSYCFVVTDAGRAFVKALSPSPPRLTRGQIRYQAYQSEESGLSFGEWLRSNTR
jgi:hypothetical protein